MPQSNNTSSPTTPRTLWRGLCGRCPNCGSGRLFKSYLKPFAVCGTCAQDFAPLRADDGPAWLTVLLMGHVTLPFVLLAVQYDLASETIITASAVALALTACLVILPRAKGLFMAAIWLTHRKPG